MSVLPQLKVYNAIEPDESLRETLTRRLETWGGNIQVTEVKCQYAGADPGFSVGGGANHPWEGANIQIIPKTA